MELPGTSTGRSHGPRFNGLTQEFNVDRFFPIREVLEHKAGYHGFDDAAASERADEALRTVGIYDKRDTRFDWLFRRGYGLVE